MAPKRKSSEGRERRSKLNHDRALKATNSVCFDVKDGLIELIDNSQEEPDFAKRYGGVPEILRHTMYLTLRRLCERSEGIDRIDRAPIHWRKMPWRTKNNIEDCGIFTIRHMETYKGNKNWSCGFVAESDLQKQQLDSYKAKMMQNAYKRVLKRVDNMS